MKTVNETDITDTELYDHGQTKRKDKILTEEEKIR